MVEMLTIESLGAQGDGVTADGVFVPGTLPGELVRANLQGHRADLVAIIDAAPDRQPAACPHFDTCGGCSLQHASDGLLGVWKQDLVRKALAARGISGVDIRTVLSSPPRSRRRVTFAGKRTKKGTLVGFHAAGSDAVIPVSSCTVATAGIMTVVPRLARVVEAGASRKGALRISVTETEAGLDVSIDGGKPVEGGLYGELVAFAATADLARLSWDGETVVTRRPPIIAIGPAEVVPPPGGFLQATEAGQAALIAAAKEATSGARRIADLFAGSGTLTLPLAQSAEIHAVESDAAALEALDIAWRQTAGLRRVGTETRDLYRRPLLPAEFGPFDAVVLDPPRQGARAQCEHLAKADIKQIAAASCNPATFARDARMLLDGGFRLDWIQPIDQFLWSPHVELMAAFSRP
ncbi:MAG: class I SAM-dependent RNA methyltransferase [Paracoccaceae bacterium]